MEIRNNIKSEKSKTKATQSSAVAQLPSHHQSPPITTSHQPGAVGLPEPVAESWSTLEVSGWLGACGLCAWQLYWLCVPQFLWSNSHSWGKGRLFSFSPLTSVVRAFVRHQLCAKLCSFVLDEVESRHCLGVAWSQPEIFQRLSYRKASSFLSCSFKELYRRSIFINNNKKLYTKLKENLLIMLYFKMGISYIR